MSGFRELVKYLQGTSAGVRIEHQLTAQKESEMERYESENETRHKPNHVMAEITNITRRGSAFARVNGTTKDIYIPTSIVTRTGLALREQVIVASVPNRLYEDWSPDSLMIRPPELFAIHVQRLEEIQKINAQFAADVPDIDIAAARGEPEAEAPEKAAPEKLLDALKLGPSRAGPLSRVIGEPQATTFSRLEALHRDGLVARSAIYGMEQQRNASYVVWALDAKSLVPRLANLEGGDAVREL